MTGFHHDTKGALCGFNMSLCYLMSNLNDYYLILLDTNYTNLLEFLGLTTEWRGNEGDARDLTQRGTVAEARRLSASGVYHVINFDAVPLKTAENKFATGAEGAEGTEGSGISKPGLSDFQRQGTKRTPGTGGTKRALHCACSSFLITDYWAPTEPDEFVDLGFYKY